MNSLTRLFRITVGIFFSLNFALFWAIPIMIQVDILFLIEAYCFSGTVVETLLTRCCHANL